MAENGYLNLDNLHLNFDVFLHIKVCYNRPAKRSAMFNFIRKKQLSSSKMIILGFATVILMGTIILMLPVSSKASTFTPFHEALFTATSAVCVTGLVVRDTGSYWSEFGQGIILLLIQIGGLGVVTVGALFSILSGKKISILQRSTMQDAISAPKVGGIVRLTRFILRGTLLIELTGMLIMLPTFCRDYGLRGIWLSFFHSISAFCNGGFDILGTPKNQYISLTSYVGNISINIAIILLIIIGGIGFLTWDDIYTNKWHFKKYSVQSKIILITTSILIIIPAIFFYFYEFGGLSLNKRILASLFQSTTLRTAGFNTVNFSDMDSLSRGIMIVLMLIGGSPGSTAGGIKTTTFAILIINTVAICRKKEDAEVFGRRFESSVIKNASAIAMIYLLLFFASAGIISITEKLPLDICLYETASAIGTVGVTLGITPNLKILSQIILVILMFLGRVGSLTLIYATISKKNQVSSKFPLERITVG